LTHSQLASVVQDVNFTANSLSVFGILIIVKLELKNILSQWTAKRKEEEAARKSNLGTEHCSWTNEPDTPVEGGLSILGGVLPTCNERGSPGSAGNPPLTTAAQSSPSRDVESSVPHNPHNSILSDARGNDKNDLASPSRADTRAPNVGPRESWDDDLAFEEAASTILQKVITIAKKCGRPFVPLLDRPPSSHSHTSSDLSRLLTPYHLNLESSASAMAALHRTTQENIADKNSLERGETKNGVGSNRPHHATDSENSITTDDTDIDDLTSEITDYSVDPDQPKDMPPVFRTLGSLSTWNVMVALCLILRPDQSVQQFGASSRASFELLLSTIDRGSVKTHSGSSSSSSNQESTQSDRGKGKANASGGNNISNGKRPLGGGASQYRHDDKHDDSEDEDEGSKKRPRLSPRFCSPAKKKFACPFFKRAPESHQRWRACAGPGWDTVHRVKYV
jgi:hypothetical protein